MFRSCSRTRVALVKHKCQAHCSHFITAGYPLRLDTEQQNDSPSTKKSVIPAGMPESSHTPALSAAEGDVKL